MIAVLLLPAVIFFLRLEIVRRAAVSLVHPPLHEGYYQAQICRLEETQKFVAFYISGCFPSDLMDPSVYYHILSTTHRDPHSSA